MQRNNLSLRNDKIIITSYNSRLGYIVINPFGPRKTAATPSPVNNREKALINIDSVVAAISTIHVASISKGTILVARTLHKCCIATNVMPHQGSSVPVAGQVRPATMPHILMVEDCMSLFHRRGFYYFQRIVKVGKTCSHRYVVAI